MQRFNAFIRGHCDTPGEEPKYMQLLQETRARGEQSFNVDGGHIHAFDPTLYNWTVSFPVETVPIFDYQLALIIAEMEGVDDPEALGYHAVPDLQPARQPRSSGTSTQPTSTTWWPSRGW